MAMSAQDSRLLVHSVEELAMVVRKRAGRKGSRLARLTADLAQAAPNYHLIQVVDLIGGVLARQTDKITLSVGPHQALTGVLEPLNRGAAYWLTSFFAVAEGPRLTDNVILNMEQHAADLLLESHHVVEVRAWEHYAELQSAFPAVAADGRPGERAMWAIAIPSELHRGARYANLERKTTRMAQLRRGLPAREYNLTTNLMQAFPESYLETVPLPTYLQQLSEFYRTELPGLYQPVMPSGEPPGGMREALLRIADATSVSRLVIAP